MAPFVLYLSVALIRGTQLTQLILWAVWGRPAQTAEYVALLGAALLVLAAFLALRSRRVSAAVALGACGLMWIHDLPATWFTLRAALLEGEPYAALGLLFPLLTAAATAHAALALRAEVGRRPATRWLPTGAAPGTARAVLVSAATGTAVTVLVLWLFVGAEREVAFATTWRVQDEDAARPVVRFDYVGHPGCYETVDSRRVLDWLRASRADTVDLVLGVTYDFGRVRGYGLHRVGALDVNLTGEWSGGFPPWDAFP